MATIRPGRPACPRAYFTGRWGFYDAISATTALIDARGHRFSFTYDAAGQRTVSIDPLNRRITSAYDAAGRQSYRIDARGNRTTYVYDDAAALTGRRYPNGARTTFVYDSSGNRTRLEEGAVVTTSTYDAARRRHYDPAAGRLPVVEQKITSD